MSQRTRKLHVEVPQIIRRVTSYRVFEKNQKRTTLGIRVHDLLRSEMLLNLFLHNSVTLPCCKSSYDIPKS